MGPRPVQSASSRLAGGGQGFVRTAAPTCFALACFLPSLASSTPFERIRICLHELSCASGSTRLAFCVPQANLPITRITMLAWHAQQPLSAHYVLS